MGVMRQFREWRKSRQSRVRAPTWMLLSFGIILLTLGLFVFLMAEPGAGLTQRTARAIGYGGLPHYPTRPWENWQASCVLLAALFVLSSIVVIALHVAAGRALGRKNKAKSNGANS